MDINPANLYFRICGVAPTRSYSRYLYCIVPLLIASEIMEEILTMLPNSQYASVIPMFVGMLQILLTCNLFPDGFLSILDEVKAVDEQLEQMGVSVEPQGLSKTMVISFVSHILRMKTSIEIVKAFKHLSFIIMVNVAWIQHLVFAQMIHKRYSALNDHLARIAATADKTLLQIVETLLDSVFRVHSHLHVIISDINSHYFIYNLTAMASRFCMLALFAYRCLEGFTVGEVSDLFFKSRATVIPLIMITCQTLACHSCANEANRTALIAHRMLTEHSPLLLWEKVGQFSRLNLDNKVEFSVGGVFSFDMTLLTKLSAMVFSFLFIAIQLKDVNVSNLI